MKLRKNWAISITLKSNVCPTTFYTTNIRNIFAGLVWRRKQLTPHFTQDDATPTNRAESISNYTYALHVMYIVQFARCCNRSANFRNDKITIFSVCPRVFPPRRAVKKPFTLQYMYLLARKLFLMTTITSFLSYRFLLLAVSYTGFFMRHINMQATKWIPVMFVKLIFC